MITLLKESRPTARKDHRCDLCNGPIKPGDKYLRQTLKYDDVYDWKECSACENDEIAGIVWGWSVYDEGIMAEDVLEWATEAARHPNTPAEGDTARRLLERSKL